MPDQKKISLGIMIPTLKKYGGAERYLIETVFYWQSKYNITIYAVEINKNLLIEHNIDLKLVKLKKLTDFYEGDNSLLLNTIVLTKVWRSEIEKHDIYMGHLWPMHFTELKPFLWVTHEPLRIMHDLKYEHTLSRTDSSLSKNFHLYPKFNYDRLTNTHEISLNIIDKLDRTFSPEMIIANSKYTAKNLSKIYNNKETSYSVAYPGIDYASYFDGMPFDKNLFITVGQLWSHKRMHLLIEAISLTNLTQLIIVGSGPEKENLEKISEKLGVSDRVFILSDLSNQDLLHLLARSCAFLFSAFKEPFGIVVLEALAASKPIIAVDEGGFTEVLHSDYSFLVKPYPIEFAKKISYLQENPDEAIKMGKLARQAVKSYTWKKSADDIEDAMLKMYSKFITNHRASSYKNHSMDKKLLIGMQYFLWYGEGLGASHWNDDEIHGLVSEHPEIGYYSSLKGETIRHHLDLAENIGIDFLCLNLHIEDKGVNEIELHSILNLFDIVNSCKYKIKLAIQICLYTNDERIIGDSLAFIKKTFIQKDEYLEINGKKVLFWFWSGAFDSNSILIPKLKEFTNDLDNIAFSNRIADESEDNLTFNMFNGFGPFSPIELSDPLHWERVWNESLENTQNIKYKVFSVCPGYDDRHIMDLQRTNNPYRYVPRNEGETYKKTWEFAIRNKATIDIVMISTFNEYHENTHIEPTIQQGNGYIKMTKDFILKIKK